MTEKIFLRVLRADIAYIFTRKSYYGCEIYALIISFMDLSTGVQAMPFDWERTDDGWENVNYTHCGTRLQLNWIGTELALCDRWTVMIIRWVPGASTFTFHADDNPRIINSFNFIYISIILLVGSRQAGGHCTCTCGNDCLFVIIAFANGCFHSWIFISHANCGSWWATMSISFFTSLSTAFESKSFASSPKQRTVANQCN